MNTTHSPITRMTWAEFRESGLFWAVNRWLHMFGLVIVIDTDDETGEFVDAYPARTAWRGFPPESEERGFTRVAAWMRGMSVKDSVSPAASAPELGPIALAKSKDDLPVTPVECRTASWARRADADSVLIGFVVEHGEKLWRVEHADGCVGVYHSDEVEDRT